MGIKDYRKNNTVFSDNSDNAQNYINDMRIDRFYLSFANEISTHNFFSGKKSKYR